MLGLEAPNCSHMDKDVVHPVMKETGRTDVRNNSSMWQENIMRTTKENYRIRFNNHVDRQGWSTATSFLAPQICQEGDWWVVQLLPACLHHACTCILASFGHCRQDWGKLPWMEIQALRWWWTGKPTDFYHFLFRGCDCMRTARDVWLIVLVCEDDRT